MFAFRELLAANADRLAAVITAEHGKTLDDARGEVQRGLEVVEFACGIPQLLKGEMSENVGTGIDSYAMRQPLGVCAGISPFNFPAMVPMWMFPVALACGNAFIMKPSEKDPSLCLELAALLKQAGLPDGAFNVVNGDREAVEALLAHPGVAAVSFVGSTPVAQRIYARCAETGKRVQALGGAKNHLVVHARRRSGRCGRRADGLGVRFGRGTVHGDLGGGRGRRRRPTGSSSGSRSASRRCAWGRGTNPASRWARSSPPSTARGSRLHRLRRARGRVARRRRTDAAVRRRGLLPGRDALRPSDAGDAHLPRRDLRTGARRRARSHLQAALELVNAHEFGNGAAIFTRDGGTARTFAHHVSAGMVGVNVPIPVPLAFHSFGGWKRSLFGDMAIHGPEGVRFYTRLKTTTVRWPSANAGASFVMPTH